MEENERDLLIRIDENVNSMLDRVKNIEKDLSELKTDNAINKEKICTNESEIEKLRSETRVINAITALVLSVLGFFGLRAS